MQLEDFDFPFDKELIAKEPVHPRDSARLLSVNPNSYNLISEAKFSDLPTFLKKGDLVILNNTKVIPAFLIGKITTVIGSIKFNLHKAINEDEWLAFCKPAKKVNIDDSICFGGHFFAKVIAKNAGEVLLKFNSGSDTLKMLHQYGTMPIPPYIKQEEGAAVKNKTDYQTIYAKSEGSVAAPTAGLHFTHATFAAFKTKGINTAFITLHVGAGTFLPVITANILEHKMHSEYFELTQDVVDTINKTKAGGGRIIAVGTTTARVLESCFDGRVLHPKTGETDIFIYPGYQFKIVDILLTNFHLPKSTLFMLVAAFCGLEVMKKAYNYAVNKKFRFFSFGDTSILYKKNS